ncbi:hypothetical protein F66182_11385, partial [Fusarium sp. NRRL 66182]
MFIIIVEESGVGDEDLQDDTLLASVGIDSLLSLIITSRLKDDLGFYSNSGLTVFDEFRTYSIINIVVVIKNERFFDDYISQEKHTQYTESYEITKSSESHLSVILQRASTVSSMEAGGKILFLFPDGSGSALSYVDIPRVNESVTIIGLISPFRKRPEAMKTCNLDELISIYLAEIRRRQSHGPYNLGGWSAGGILAFRAMTELIQQGETVENLVLIDSPDPTSGLGRLPQGFYDHCQAQGIFGQIEKINIENNIKTGFAEEQTSGQYTQVPPWLVPHFNATIDMLHDYHAKPLIKDSKFIFEPRVSIYLATECVFDGNDYASFPAMPGEATHSMEFLTKPRTDFSAGGWAKLFLGQEIRVRLAHGANHFSMM